MKTLKELEALEQLAHDTGLRGEALQKKFAEQSKEVTPFYRHKPKLLYEFFHWIYEEVSEWRIYRHNNIDDTTELLPPFDAWCGTDILDMIEAHESWHG